MLRRSSSIISADGTDPNNSIFNSFVERARGGDLSGAILLLNQAIYCLQKGTPFPEPLRLYLLDAFRKITKSEPLQRFLREDAKEQRAVQPPPVNDTMAVLRDLLAHAKKVEEKTAELIGDANEALNLKPKPGKRLRSLDVFHLEAALLHVPVKAAMESGKTFQDAVADVAKSEGVSESTVARAWEWRDQYHGNKGLLLAEWVLIQTRDGQDIEQAVDHIAVQTGATKQAIRRAWRHWKDRLTGSEKPGLNGSVSE